MSNQPPSDAADQSLHSWPKLAATLRGISPAGYLRIGLVLLAAAGLFWIFWQTRTALLPFFIGAVIAYILLPLVNSMDRLMPRFLAVVIALAFMLGCLAFLFYLLIPPLIAQAPKFIELLPDRAEIQVIVSQLRTLAKGLPVPAQEAIAKIIESVSLTLREYLDQSLSGLLSSSVIILIKVFNSIGFILGFLVVPAWLLSVLQDQQKAVRRLNRVLPASIQPDFWALIKIIDRPLRTYVSGQFLLAVITGFAVYFSFVLLEKLGLPPVEYKVPLALWAAVFELIPQIGPYLGAIPAVLVGFYRSPQIGLGVIALYIILHYLINGLAGSRIENRLLQIHPAIMLVVIVALSQLGFFWILIAAPVISSVTNLFRYLYGRLSDPPLPAGVLPGQPVPGAPTVQETPVYHIPRVYQTSRAARRPSERM